MSKLNQIIAVVQGKKTGAKKFVTGIHHGWSKDRITGINRTYQPKDDDGDQYPTESAPVQLKVVDSLRDVVVELTDFFNVVATQEYGNTLAVGDIIVDGETVIKDVPVSMLLFLEKQLTDIRSVMVNLPTLPTDKVWSFDDNKGCWVTEPEKSIKTKKMPKVILLHGPTIEHPAQTELLNVDEVIGNWTTIHMSGAVPATYRKAMISRVEKMQDAVKMAREQANCLEVTQQLEFGAEILRFLFKKD